MARFKGWPSGYDPALEFNLREQNEGGDLRRPGQLRTPGDVPDARRECLVLVHGFNNHAGEAATAYLGFRSRQYAQFEDLSPGALERRFGDVFWPGDAEWPGPTDWFDFLIYPVAVGKARDAAPLLADLLWKLPNLERVDFIAHSLGCRVVLETIERLQQRGRPALGRICLMAAAVPNEMVEPGGRFEALLYRLEAQNVPVRVLHSKRDLVLAVAFILGQPLAGEPTRGALGRAGPPADMPGRGANVTDRRVTGAGHSHYWGHQASEASEMATHDTGDFFKIGNVRRTIRTRAVGEARGIGWEREVGEESED